MVHLRTRLDPRPARPGRPVAAALRGREHERHQGRRGRRQLRHCRTTTSLHQAICRVVAGGITVVAAAANDTHNASTTSRRPTTRSSRSRRWPTRTASPAGSAATAASRGAATTRTTRSPTSATTAATSTSWPPASASGRRCPARLRLHVGHVHGGPGGHRRRGPLQVEPAQRDAGRGQARRSGISATSTGRRRPIRTRSTSSSSTSRGSGRSGTFDVAAGRHRPPVEAGGRPRRAVPSSSAARRSSSGSGSRSRPCPPAGRRRSADQPVRLDRDTRRRLRDDPRRDARSARTSSACAARNQGRSATPRSTVDGRVRQPDREGPTSVLGYMTQLGTTTVPVTLSSWPAATDPIERDRRLRGPDAAATAGRGAATLAPERDAPRRPSYSLRLGVTYAFRVRARDGVGNWSPWVVGRSRPASSPSTIGARRSTYTGHGRETARPTRQAARSRPRARPGRGARLTVHRACHLGRRAARAEPGQGRRLHRRRLHRAPSTCGPRPRTTGRSSSRGPSPQRHAHGRVARHGRHSGRVQFDAFVVTK